MHPNEHCNCRYADVGCDRMEQVMDQISGKWKMRILFMVGAHGTLRYGELRKLLDGVPDCCSATLREQGRKRSTSGLIITHTGHILEYVNADRGQVMYHGKLCCEARPRVILDHIAQHGYQECLRCLAGDMYGKIAEAPLA